MPQWEIGVQIRVEAATPDEATAWLANELHQKLSPGEEGSPWKDGVGAAPRYNLSSVRQVVTESPTPQRSKST